MTHSLPPNPSLENLRKQAKTLKKAWQAGDTVALERIQAAHPRFPTAQPRLADCQLVLARECGFHTWRELKAAVESARSDLPEQFVTIACLCYDDPHYDHRMFHARAHEMLKANPWLAGANGWSAAAAGNTAALQVFLDGDPELANRPGPHGWVPLICACYSRVRPTFEAARLLLDRGADPNAYTMKGNADERLDQTGRRFTALDGLFGGGSTGMANQPPHPQWRELAELLLNCGAHPADEIAIEISQGEQTYAKLEMLLRHGLTRAAASAAGATLMGRALALAVIAGDGARVKLLLDHHARTDETFRGKTPWQHAMERGHLEIARQLEAAGAPVADLDEVGRFVSLCLAGDARGAHAMLGRSPDLPSRAPKELALKAVSTGRIGAVKLVLDLGFDPNFMDEVTALHSAAGGDRQEIMRLLLARGGSLTVREPFYDGTPVEWADFFDQRAMREMLLDEGPICLFDALDHDRLDRIPDILARDPAALNRPFAECLSREPKPEDWQTPLARMRARGKMEAVRVLEQYGAR